MLDLLAFVVVAVGLATPFVVPLMWASWKTRNQLPELASEPRSFPDTPVPRF